MMPTMMTDDTNEQGGPLDNWVTPAWAVEAVLPCVAPIAEKPTNGWCVVDPGAGIGDVTLTLHKARLPMFMACAVELHPGRSRECARRFDADLADVPHVNVTGDWLDPDVGKLVGAWAAAGSVDRRAVLVMGNPPYTKPRRTTGLEFIEQAIRVASPAGVVALLLPLDFAAGVDRAARLHDRWPCSCYPLRRRPAFGEEGSSGKRPVAWFVWDLGAPHRREFRVL